MVYLWDVTRTIKRARQQHRKQWPVRPEFYRSSSLHHHRRALYGLLEKKKWGDKTGNTMVVSGLDDWTEKVCWCWGELQPLAAVFPIGFLLHHRHFASVLRHFFKILPFCYLLVVRLSHWHTLLCYCIESINLVLILACLFLCCEWKCQIASQHFKTQSSFYFWPAVHTTNLPITHILFQHTHWQSK